MNRAVYALEDKKPTRAHANNEGHILFYDPIGKWMSGPYHADSAKVQRTGACCKRSPWRNLG